MDVDRVKQASRIVILQVFSICHATSKVDRVILLAVIVARSLCYFCVFIVVTVVVSRDADVAVATMLSLRC